MLGDRVHLSHAAKDIGLPSLTRFMILAYMHANYLRDSVDINRVVRLAVDFNVHGKTLQNLRRLSKIAFELNPQFREVTTQFYFKLHRVPGKFDVDFLKLIEESTQAQDFLRQLT